MRSWAVSSILLRASRNAFPVGVSVSCSKSLNPDSSKVGEGKPSPWSRDESLETCSVMDDAKFSIEDMIMANMGPGF